MIRIALKRNRISKVDVSGKLVKIHERKMEIYIRD